MSIRRTARCPTPTLQPPTRATALVSALPAASSRVGAGGGCTVTSTRAVDASTDAAADAASASRNPASRIRPRDRQSTAAACVAHAQSRRNAAAAAARTAWCRARTSDACRRRMSAVRRRHAVAAAARRRRQRTARRAEPRPWERARTHSSLTARRSADTLAWAAAGETLSRTCVRRATACRSKHRKPERRSRPRRREARRANSTPEADRVQASACRNRLPSAARLVASSFA
mmetsp:Transcript_9827/g.31645  ORF Transcript_9827/g.31645 Transcript_9827/m.31645 type:complete len:232 (-) Transcript_9827:169-864(-)|eukprot:scaffold15215_cov103-Isochrysis_galbana.AAC.3